jgi:5-methylcytosine-specific restriction endonuclease McrA
MADFSEATMSAALSAAGRRCQCTREGHGHDRRRCNVELSGTGRDTHYHHITSELAGGSNTLSNCEVLCIKCHQATGSYGRH